MAKEADNSFGIASVILGILSITTGVGVFLVFPYGPFLGLILGIITLIFSLIQKKKSANAWSKAGLILGITGIVLNILLIIWLVNLILQIIENLKQLQQSGALTQVGTI